MRIKIVSLLAWALCAGLLVGCDTAGNEQSSSKPAANIMTAKYTSVPVVVDGILDEPVWQETAVYKMYLPADRSADSQMQEAGQVRLAWDEEYFYVAVKLDDSDIVAEGTADQLHHYRLGDVCELFLKPADKTWYWELYVTPRGNKTTFFFPSQGRFGLPGCFENYSSDLQVGAQCQGTLNNWQDRDGSWTAEMAMPIKDLTARGERFGLDADWRILVARYNYSYHLTRNGLELGPELSAAPRLSVTNYHLLEEYAILKLSK